MNNSTKNPPLIISLIPIFFLIVALWFTVVRLADYQISVHLPLIGATFVASVIAFVIGRPWNHILQGMVDGVKLATGAILILLVIGILVATWIQSGVVPAMLFYGFDILSPKYFLAAACLLCAFTSLFTGSSWSTIATFGIALMGIGKGLEIPVPYMAGAIISGSYFGDKMSPLSDTTNLAPAVAGSDLFEHIRHMLYTTGPSLVLSLLAFLFLGFNMDNKMDTTSILSIKNAISHSFYITPWLFVLPVAVIAMIVLKIPALPAVFLGALGGAIFSVIFQGSTVAEVLKASSDGIELSTGNDILNNLLSRGGLKSMFSTIALILCAMAFGGVMEKSRMLHSIAFSMLRLARNTGNLISVTIVTCITMNFTASDQYLAIVVPGRMFRKAYTKMGLSPVNLSRALEDSATLTSPLIPWNTCGAFIIATLGISPWVYVPFCFLNLLNPIISIIYGYTGFSIKKIDSSG